MKFLNKFAFAIYENFGFVMLGFLSVISILISILLIIVVLLQPGKGDIASGLGGLSGQFSSILGTRRAADFLSKLTIGFAIAILALSLITNYFFVGGEKEIQRAPTEGLSLPPANTPPMDVPTLPPSPEK
jgi:protein translocase SecG subunit